MFNPNLIIIKNDKNIVGIHKVKHDYTIKDYYVEITNNKNEIIYKGTLTNNSFIEIDIRSIITIKYYEKITNVLFDREELNFSEIYSDLIISDNPINSILKKVENEMDNPKGSMPEIEYHTIMIKKSVYDKKARSYVEDKIKNILLKEKDIEIKEVDKLAKEIYANLYGMGVLQELDDDLDVSEIMVNAYSYPKFKCDIYYTKTNKPKQRYNKTFKDLNELLNIYARAVSFSKKELNSLENASIETTRANGDRVSVIIPEASENYILNIRKFSNFIPNRRNMLNVGTINEEIDKLMSILVKGKANIGIGGEMGTGKTTFINYLLTYTEPIERKAIISNVKEINSNRMLDNHDIVFLNIDDEKGFTFEKQMRIALRTTADRIIVPETRGGEFKQVYEANLKTKGNIFTAHATDDEIFLDVCADMYVENSPSDISFIKNKIAKSIDIIIIMKKINDKIRIKSISEILLDKNGKYKGLNLLYFWDFKDKRYIKTENKISDDLKNKLFEEGISNNLLERI